MIHLGQHQTNKVIITKSPPNRQGCILIDKISNTVVPINASYTRGTEIAEVEGLWLSRRPSSVFLNNQTTIPLQPNSPVWLHFLFYISLPFMHERFS